MQDNKELKFFTMRIPAQLHEDIKIYSTKNKISMSNFAIECLTSQLNKNTK